MSSTSILEKARELRVYAEMKYLNDVIDFIANGLEDYNCSGLIKNQVSLVIEDIFCNIVNYAYKQRKGEVTIKCCINNGNIVIVMTDYGRKFNPLIMHEQDVAMETEKREIGGLGIYLVKRTVDKISYRFKNGRNILTFVKFLTD